MTHNGIPEEKKRRMRKREQKLETPLWCSVFFFNYRGIHKKSFGELQVLNKTVIKFKCIAQTNPKI
jgi:hypothetical protein